jgi:hypothetical protein
MPVSRAKTCRAAREVGEAEELDATNAVVNPINHGIIIRKFCGKLKREYIYIYVYYIHICIIYIYI